MKTLIGTAAIAAILALGGPAAVAATNPVPQAKPQAAATSDTTDFSARRYHRRYYGYRPYYRTYPQYYARPTYYRPYPYYAPAPFPFGLGYGPFWW